METGNVEPTKRRSRVKKTLLIVGLFVLIGGAVFGRWLDSSPSGNSSTDIISRIRRNLLSKEAAYGAPVNLLLIGSDSRNGENARSDTLMFVRLDFKKNRVYLVSVPRDTRVFIPGRGMDKINAAFAYGGAPLVIRTIENFLGVDLNHYAEIDFNGFKSLVDTLGGIDITIDKAIIDRSREYGMYIPAGRQHMNGETALNYVRYRHGDSDFDRAKRQQRFVRALAANAFRIKSIFKLPTLAGIFEENVGTDMTKRQMLSIGGFMKQLPKNRIESVTVKGRSTVIDGISYVVPDRSEINVIMETIESGRSIKDMKSWKQSDKMLRENNVLPVSLLNGSGKRGLAVRAKARLTLRGFRKVSVRDADRFDYKKTEIRYPRNRKLEAYRVRRLLFGGAVMTPNDKNTTGDIEVILGADYYRYERY